MQNHLLNRRCTENHNSAKPSSDLDLLTLRGIKKTKCVKEPRAAGSLLTSNKTYPKTESVYSDFSNTTDFFTDLLVKPVSITNLLNPEDTQLEGDLAQLSREKRRGRPEMDFYNNPKNELNTNEESSSDDRYFNQDLLMPNLRSRTVQGSDLLSNKVCVEKTFNSDSESVSSTSSRGSVKKNTILKKKTLSDSAKKTELSKFEQTASNYRKRIEERQHQPLPCTSNINHTKHNINRANDETDPEIDLCKLNVSRNVKKRPEQKVKLLKDKKYGLPYIESSNIDFELLHYGSNNDGGDAYEADLSGFLKEPVNWGEIKVPKKRELHRVIHHRLCNYINPDIMLVIDEHEFFCHRIVLQSYSKFFDEIDNLERNAVIDLKEKKVTKEAFIAIYAWMLSLNEGGLKFLTRENIIEVLMASQSLQIRDLEEQCFALIDSKEIFCEGHAYQLFKQAGQLGQNDIKELMVPRVQNFFLPLVSTQDFVNLSLQDLSTFLSSNYIVVHSEMEVFMSAARWLLNNWEERKKHLPKVMTCIRFGLMDPSELIDIRKNPESPEFLKITEDTRIQIFIEDGMAYSVESTLKGKTEDHKYRCQLLGLEVPQPRNWAETTKHYKSYEEFLSYLQLLRTNPMLMFSKEPVHPPADTQSKGGYRGGHPMAIHRNPSSCDLFRVPCNTVCEDTIPSMSVLLSAGMRNRKRKENQSETIRFNNDMNAKEIEKLEKKCTFNKEKELQNEYQHRKIDKAERSKRNVQKRKETSLKSRAAVIIQSAYRGYRSRKMLRPRKRELSSSLCNRSVKFDENKVIEDKEETHKKHVQNCHSDSEGEIINRFKGNLQSSLYSTQSQTILVIGGLDPLQNLSQHNDGSSIFRYSIELNKWEKVSSIPKGRYCHNAVFLKGKVYVLGGVDPRKEETGSPAVCSDMWSFNPANCEWQKEPSLRTARKTFGLIVFHGYLFIIGGQDDQKRILSSVEKYDPVKGTWEEVSALPEPRLCPSVCRYGGMIWVAGGMGSSTKNDMSSHIFCLDPQQNMWIRKPALRFGRGFSALISHESNLLIVGGAIKENDISVSNDTVDVVDPNHNKWRLHSHMSIPRHSHTVSCIGSKMFIIGGSTTKYRKSLSNVEMCCLKSGIWNREVAELPVPLTGHASVTLPQISPVNR